MELPVRDLANAYAYYKKAGLFRNITLTKDSQTT